MKTITFGIVVDLVVYQNFEVPDDYQIESNSIDETYEKIYSNCATNCMSYLADGDINPYEFDVESMAFDRFNRIIIQDSNRKQMHISSEDFNNGKSFEDIRKSLSFE